MAAKVALTAAGEVSWLDTVPHLFVLAATAVGSPETALAAAVVAAAVEIVTAAAVCGPSVAAILLPIDLVASGAAASIAYSAYSADIVSVAAVVNSGLRLDVVVVVVSLHSQTVVAALEAETAAVAPTVVPCQ